MNQLLPRCILLLLIAFSATVADSQIIYRLANRFENTKFQNLYKLNATTGVASSTAKSIASSLKGYITKMSEGRDSLYIKFWNIFGTDPHQGSTTLVNSADNGATFAYYLNWGNTNSFSVPFTAKAFTATTIPFRYRLKKQADLEAEFLNVGVNLFFIHGHTKFFKQEQIESRQTYWGFGPFIGLSQLTLDSSNTGNIVKTEKKVADISYGISGIRSWNGFSIVLALGFDNAIGYNGKHWEENNFKHGVKPYIGFGFGIKLTELAFKSTNESK